MVRKIFLILYRILGVRVMSVSDNATSEILQRVTSVETKLDMLLEDRKVATEALRVANLADASASSAHKRLDKIDKIIFWGATTIIGAPVLALIGFSLKGGLTN